MDALRPQGQATRAESSDGRADLHVHSLYSDGGQTPEAIVRAAAGRLDVVAITDHAELGVDVVVGEEISTLNGHLLGLYALRFLRVWRRRRLVACAAPTVSLRQGGHRGHS
jgi:hypothetical protein